jgi:hypothetical protein
VIGDDRYWGPLWLEANDRIRTHPNAAHLIVARYSAGQWKDARRTAVCAASFNTPLWQEAVAKAYPTQRQDSLFGEQAA